MTIQPMTPELWPAVVPAMLEVLPSDVSFEIISATGGFVYTRKGEQCFDMFGQPRNPSYGTSHDDIVLSLTVRFPQIALKRGGLPAVVKLQAAAEFHERGKLQAEIDKAIVLANAANERVQELVARRDNAT